MPNGSAWLHHQFGHIRRTPSSIRCQSCLFHMLSYSTNLPNANSAHQKLVPVITDLKSSSFRVARLSWLPSRPCNSARRY